MKTKQGNWIVECENREQTCDVINYADKSTARYWGFWKFVCYLENETSDIFSNLKDAKGAYPNAELISFSDWENLPNDETDKELIGWKLEKEEYREAAGLIAFTYDDKNFYESNDGTNFNKGSLVEERLKEAGVLELWFTPVYKEEEEQKTLKLSFGELTQDDIEQLKKALK